MTPGPLAVIALPVACGILAAAYLSFPACLFVAAAIMLFVPLARTGPARTVLAVVAASFAVGAARYAVSTQIPASNASRFAGGSAAFQGIVVSDPESRSDRVRLIVRVNRVQTLRGWVAATGRAMVSVYQPVAGKLKLSYGDHILARANLYKPRDPSNPGQVPWREYLARQRIYSCASIRRAEDVTIRERGKGNFFVAGAIKAKDYLIASVEKAHPPQEAALVNGMVLGTYSYLPSDVLRSFARTGTLHMLAASGYNCFVLVFIAAPVLTFLRVLPRHKNLVLILLLFWYLMMVGEKPSLVRATAMASLYLFGVQLRRVPDTRNLFFAAVLIVLMMNPSDLFDVGFQLSFLAVWGLISVAPVIEGLLRSAGWGAGSGLQKPAAVQSLLARKTSSLLGGAAVATIAVTLVTAPIVAYYFNYFSIVSLPANVILGIGVPVVFADGLLSLVFAHVPILGPAIGTIGTWASAAMLKSVQFLGSAQWSAVSLPSPPPLAILGYYVVLFGLYDHVRPKRGS